MNKFYVVSLGNRNYVSKDLKVTKDKSKAFTTNDLKKAKEVADFLMSKKVKNVRVLTLS